MVRETEAESPIQVVNQVVSVPYSLSGEAVSAEDIKLLATSRDFYSYPRLSSDGRKLAYVCWNHPNMPWDNTELLVQDLDADGLPEGEPRRVSAGGEESVCQPLWTPSGALVFLSDSTTGFYNLHVVDVGSTSARCLLARPGTEFCSSHQGWSLGLQSFHLLSDDTLICTFGQDGVSKLCTVRVSTGKLTILELPDLPPAISEVAVRLQHTTSHCNMLQHAATCCNLSAHMIKRSAPVGKRERERARKTATHCSTLQHTATHCNTLQLPAIPCNTLQHSATRCNILQHSATRCNTLQHTGNQ